MRPSILALINEDVSSTWIIFVHIIYILRFSIILSPHQLRPGCEELCGGLVAAGEGGDSGVLFIIFLIAPITNLSPLH